jgi:hypothetical protein
MSDITTIPIKKITRDRLKKYGNKGDTYNDIINNLLDYIEYNDFMDKMYNRTIDKNNFISLLDLDK